MTYDLVKTIRASVVISESFVAPIRVIESGDAAPSVARISGGLATLICPAEEPVVVWIGHDRKILGGGIARIDPVVSAAAAIRIVNCTRESAPVRVHRFGQNLPAIPDLPGMGIHVVLAFKRKVPRNWVGVGKIGQLGQLVTEAMEAPLLSRGVAKVKDAKPTQPIVLGAGPVEATNRETGNLHVPLAVLGGDRRGTGKEIIEVSVRVRLKPRLRLLLAGATCRTVGVVN